jgi:16S rRNA (guanine(1405)-N(7))-methyltransferase
MGLSAETTYLAYDVDRRLIDLVDGALTLAEQPHVAALRDVVADPPAERADVALLLKSAPCLEQQAPGSSRRLLKRLDAGWLVVSYPTKSLGGAGKGMLATYRAQFQALVGGWLDVVQELLFPNELVYVARRSGGGGERCGGGQAPALQPLEHGDSAKAAL